MEYNIATLTNGLRVIHRPSSSKVVYCGYEINAGTRDEHAHEEGIAHFCEHMAFKGTRRRKAWQIINALESVGGDLNAFTNKESTVYYAAILSTHLKKAVDLLTDIIFQSTWPQHEIDKEVEVICDEIESYNDSPAELIYDDFEHILFGNHPLGHNILGKAEQLRTYTTADAMQFAQRLYKPDNCIFFADGDISFKRLVQMLEKAMEEIGDFEKTAIPTMPALPEYVPQTITANKGTHQTHVMIGTRAYDVHDKKRLPLYLLNNLLGGPGMSSRLNLALREKNALVYSVESNMVSYEDTGMWSIYFGCDPHDTKKCCKLVHRELEKLMLKPLTERKLQAAKKQLKGQIGIACDNRENFALDFGKSFLHYGWEKNIEKLYENIDKITSAELQRVAQELFPQEQLTTLIYT